MSKMEIVRSLRRTVVVRNDGTYLEQSMLCEFYQAVVIIGNVCTSR